MTKEEIQATIADLHRQIRWIRLCRIRPLVSLHTVTLSLANYLSPNGFYGHKVYQNKRTKSKTLVIWLGLLRIGASI